MNRTSQSTLRFKVTDLPSRRSLHKSNETAFNRFERPFEEPPPSLDRRRHLFANELRRDAIAAVEAVTRASTSSIGLAVEWCRHVELVIMAALESEALPEAEKEESHKICNGNVHSLADCLLALEGARKLHRPPQWWDGNRGQLEAINRKLDVLAGLVMRTAKDAEVWSSICEESGVGR